MISYKLSRAVSEKYSQLKYFQKLRSFFPVNNKKRKEAIGLGVRGRRRPYGFSVVYSEVRGHLLKIIFVYYTCNYS